MNMSTAVNHRKRSHRSEQRHYYANMARYKIAVTNQDRKKPGMLANIIGRFRKRKAGDK